jgi:succinate dehydrogenase hydrophobic anchor subunit
MLVVMVKVKNAQNRERRQEVKKHPKFFTTILLFFLLAVHARVEPKGTIIL